MKIGNLFLFVMIILILVFEVVVLSDLVLNVEKGRQIEINNYLNDLSLSRGEIINDHLLEYKEDLKFLTESRRVRNILKKELNVDDELAKVYTENLVLVRAKEIENYLLAHSNMTLNDLQKSEEFQKIAVFPIGEDGYTAIYGSDNLVTYFHKNKNLVGQSFEDIKNNFSELYSIMDLTRKNGSARGYYSWIDINGEKRNKFGDFKQLDIKTSDEVSLTLAVTTYVDEYVIFENISKKTDEYFKDFIGIKNYLNLVLVSNDGYLAYMSNPNMKLGTNFNWGEYNLSKMADYYLKSKKSKKIEFRGPVYTTHFDRIKIAIFSGIIPVYENKEVIGHLVITGHFNHMSEIVNEEDGLGESGDIYLVNDEKFLISPVRFSNLDLFVQSVDNINVDECIEDLVEKVGNLEEKKYGGDVKEYLNYHGDKVYGTDYPIFDTNWCLIVEVDLGEIIQNSREEFSKKIHVNFAILFVFFILIFYVRRLLNKKYLIVKIDFFKKHKNILNWKFMRKINLFWSFVLGFVFSIGYFYLLSLFFGAWKNLKFYDTLPDLFILIILVVLVVLFISFFQNKNIKIRFFGAIGGGILIFSKMAEIFMQEFQFKYGVLNTNLWTIHLVSFFLGIFLLLFAVQEICRK